MHSPELKESVKYIPSGSFAGNPDYTPRTLKNFIGNVILFRYSNAERLATTHSMFPGLISLTRKPVDGELVEADGGHCHPMRLSPVNHEILLYPYFSPVVISVH